MRPIFEIFVLLSELPEEPCESRRQKLQRKVGQWPTIQWNPQRICDMTYHICHAGLLGFCVCDADTQILCLLVEIKALQISKAICTGT